MTDSRHILVIGGTGMLSKAVVCLAEAGHQVSVIGRTKEKFQDLLTETPHNVYPLLADYHTERVFGVVEQAMEDREFFDLIISWMPNYAALERICQLNNRAQHFRLVHVKGSRRYFGDEPLAIPSNCFYQEVFLGYMADRDTTRWLTHDEISDGVLRAAKSGSPREIIGQIEPYEERPL